MSSHFGVKCSNNWQNQMWPKLCFVTRNMQCLPTTSWIAPHHLWLKKGSKLKYFSRKKLYVEKAATKNTNTIHWNKWFAGWTYCGIKTSTTESSTTKCGNSWFCSMLAWSILPLLKITKDAKHKRSLLLIPSYHHQRNLILIPSMTVVVIMMSSYTFHYIHF